MGVDNPYRVTIGPESGVPGGGFLIGPRHALTAALPGLDPSASVVLSDGGQEIPGRVTSVQAGAALIEVDEPGFVTASVPDTDRCRAGDLWVTPDGGDGLVAEATTTTLRLQEAGDLAAGAPVERRAPDAEPTLVGVLVETGPAPVAATIGAALGGAAADPLLAYLRERAESGRLELSATKGDVR